jgi:hypothetical protein
MEEVFMEAREIGNRERLPIDVALFRALTKLMNRGGS